MSLASQFRIYSPAVSIVFLKTKERFGGLSNMAAGFPLRVNGVRIRTSEALYQACRFPHMPDVQRRIIDERSPMTAKMRSKPFRNESRPDWDAVRVKIMRWCLRVKLAQNWKEFGRLLLATGERPIVEQSRKDDFWGAKVAGHGSLVGMNVLGRLLMELREQLKRDDVESLSAVEPLSITEFLLFQKPIKMVCADEASIRPVGIEIRPVPPAAPPPPSEVPQPSLFDQPMIARGQMDIQKNRAAEANSNKNPKPYPGYRDSGLPWLGDVPVHWEVRRTKTLLEERSQKGFPKEPLLAATQTKGVIRKEHYENRTVLALKALHLLKLVRVRDFVISLRSFQGGIEYAREQGVISPAYTILYPRNPDAHAYLAWLFKSRPYIENLTLHVTGIRQGQNIDYLELSRSYIPLPPLPEQTVIVRYLNHVDRRIRRYVSAKRKLIALLEEEKQAVVNQAVTRGLDSNVRLKPSGVEWLGDVPEHWERCRLRNVVSVVTTGSRGWSSYASDTGPLFIRVANLNRGSLKLRFHDTVRLNLPETSEVTRTRIQAGDLLISVTAYIGSVGLAPEEFEEAYVSQHVARCQPRPGSSSRWLGYVLLSTVGQTHGQISLYGGTKDGLSLDDVKNYQILLPPLDEQLGIVEHVDKASSDIDAAMDHARRQIEVVQEYRTRLVADVVTGKLDVAEAAAQLPDKAGEQDQIEESGPLTDGIAEGLYDAEESAEEQAIESEVTV